MSDATIEMIAVREWFDAHYGNTYMSAKAWVSVPGDKQFIITIPFVYGRGIDAATREITEALESWGVIEYGATVNLVPFRDDTCTVTRRKDLHRRGRSHDLPHGSLLHPLN